MVETAGGMGVTFTNGEQTTGQDRGMNWPMMKRLQWNPSCETTPFVSEKIGLLRGVASRQE